MLSLSYCPDTYNVQTIRTPLGSRQLQLGNETADISNLCCLLTQAPSPEDCCTCLYVRFLFIIVLHPELMSVTSVGEIDQPGACTRTCNHPLTSKDSEEQIAFASVGYRITICIGTGYLYCTLHVRFPNPVNTCTNVPSYSDTVWTRPKCHCRQASL